MRLKKQLNCPSILCIDDENQCSTALDFFSSLTNYVMRDYDLEISFVGCKEITPAAALLLFSTVNHIQLKYGFNRINILNLSIGNRLTYDLTLAKSGLWDALNCQSSDDIEGLIKNNNRFKTSCEPKIIGNVKSILDTIPSLSQDHIFFLTLAMREAILNVVYHAYIDAEGNQNADELGNRWWQCAWVNKKEMIVNIIIHDRGVGILGSYKKDGFSEIEIIKEAMMQGFSRSGLANRGMGSEDMKKPVDELSGDQELTMYTGKYVYTYNLSQLEPSIVQRESEICGTLIHWKCSYGSA
ncbi:hypothetical protein [Enterobacter hormaechei]|uniref:hypothetical protein n=1 Tax=Enterobacter hormaechei TaxID=158836 RepID=UPI0029A8C92A|nr:hypothetical protein [Enterobacter hormaechei]